MIEIKTSSRGKKTEEWLRKIARGGISGELSRFGEEGVRALSHATPEESGLTSISWAYRIVKTRTGVAIEWYNTNKPDGVPVAVLIQYGHATGTGGYVHGRDYINPAMRPVFDRIANEIWKKVTYG